jgi:hypothetical protein
MAIAAAPATFRREPRPTATSRSPPRWAVLRRTGRLGFGG